MLKRRFQPERSVLVLVVLLVVVLVNPVMECRGGVEVVWEERFEVVAGKAHRGPWRMNESNFDFVDDPGVAIDELGRVGVVYADHSVLDIFFQLYDVEGNERLDEAVNVSKSPEIFSWLPRVELRVGDKLEVYILWQEIIFSGGSHGGEILFARSLDGGKTFSDPLNLSNTAAGAGKGRQDERSWHNGSYDLAVTADGTIYAVWTEYEGRLQFSCSMDGGASFSEPLLVAGGEGEKPARGPALAIGPDGGINLAWAVGEDESADIQFARSVDGGGSFSDPRPVHAGEGHTDAPKMVADSDGILHLVYPESAEGRGGRYGLCYTRAKVDELVFAEPRVIGALPGEAFRSANFPSMRIDANDNLYFVWELFHNPRGRPQGLGFTFSTDSGESFAVPVLVPASFDPELGSNGSQQGLLMNKLAVSADGRIAVVNSTFRAGVASHVWLFRGRLGGVDE